jgi:hypothetical protein
MLIPVGDGIANTLSAVIASFQEEAHSHWNYRPDAWHKDGEKTAEKTHQEDVKQ